MLYEYDGVQPELQGRVYVAPTADVIGRVVLGDQSSVWFTAVLRGDNELIIVGPGSNVQDGCVLHTDPGMPIVIGRDVTIGHGVVLHGCHVGDGSLVGNRAVVLDGARIGARCLIAAGALITPNTVVPDGSVVMGAPGKVVRAVNEKDLERIVRGNEVYKEKAAHYLTALRPLG
jgi:carbonic anhydrase/acetyltransferase-like protein (isoleucine patch superfamily)